MIAPAAVMTTIFSFNIIPEKGVEPKKLDRPYIIEVVNAKGENEAELKGISAQVDPFLISQDLKANPDPLDKFSSFPDIRMGIGSKITMHRTPAFSIKDGKKAYSIRSWKETVGEIFSEQKIEVGKDDKVNLALDAEIKDGTEIKITRVAITEVKEKKSIDFKTIKKDDDTLDKGKTRIEKKGQAGEKVLTYRVYREDGEEVSRKLINTEVTKEPTNEVILVGTRPVITVRCKYNDTVIEAAQKYGVDANSLCALMMKESNGNVGSVSGGGHLGLFQYSEGFWESASAKAGFAGASWKDARAQIFTTAWAFSHGQRGRWP